jgi:hypothetical protein
MTDNNWSIPENIQIDTQKFFGRALFQQGLKFFKLSRVSISFKKGDPGTYYIVSGIVRDDRSHEAKIVYKKRLEETNEGPLTCQCDCQVWREKGQCAHTVALFINFHVQLHLESLGEEYFSNETNLPPVSLSSNLGVNVAEYGTIIAGPHHLLGAPAIATYSSMQYLLHDKKVINFPLPITFKGRLQIYLSSHEKVKFQYLSPEGKKFFEISLLENFYLFNH